MTLDVSVIIPTFNRAHLLPRTLRSVLAQTYRNFEIVLIDDASTDYTQEIMCETFNQEMDSGLIRYIRNDVNHERSKSRNKGVSLAKGEYIAFLDDDDIWLPDHLALLVSFLENNQTVGCVFGKPAWIFEDGLVVDKFQMLFPEMKAGSGSFYNDACLRGNMVFSPSSLLKRCVIEKIGGFREDISQNEDWEFFSRVAMNFEIGYVNMVTCCFYVHQGTHSKLVVGQGAYIKEKVLKIIEGNAIKDNYQINNKVRGFVYLTLSRDFIPLMNKSREYLLKAFKADPLLALDLSVWALVFRIMLGRGVYDKIKYIKGLMR